MKQPPIKSKKNKLFSSELDFIDEIGEAFTPPDFIELPKSKPKSMLELRMENIHNMRNHFRKALAELGLKKENSDGSQRRKG